MRVKASLTGHLTAHKQLVDSYLTDLLADLEVDQVCRSTTLEERILAAFLRKQEAEELPDD